ncbi:alpha-E domain-containing protein [Octadecabacter sp. 1_MG-2023]|uniref:alpha-E domain-containing protein n=1 Tax=unclassified Octadecabacter TaxID=196158 RepID=UPI001C089C13|nr:MULTISPECIES: alpha-E domain-containing protein [unclassified Octadecabacter]MBU2994395.1 alpha-E domain-containing protein [Octadecabacter sp. B2R22]MDO6734314.1 alpha-E domain-containing protein [Octadecabacter sp. 1_MG-2023]
MLSRTAEGLFWMGRYIERMENVARLLDAGQRLESLPKDPTQDYNEWSSIVVASGATGTYPSPLEDADVASVSDHLIRDISNPSSITSCIEAARMNAKAVRNAITAEVWEAINDTRLQLHEHLRVEKDRENLSDFLDWVRNQGGLALGKVDNTMLRDDGSRFIELGKWFERADATARLLDVKYHVLLPEATDVGGGIDYLQWVQILRAANSAVAFRHLYSRVVDPQGVVDLLVLNEKSPRSLLTAMSEIAALSDKLASGLPVQQKLASDARTAETALRNTHIDAIFERGLHDWLTDFIAATNLRAQATSVAFGFGVDISPSVKETVQ